MTTTEQLSALSSILTQSGLHSLFQPIICLSERRILGYEALTRGPSNSPLHSPIALFAVARQAGRLSELEIACRQSACRRFNEQQLPGKLFLNVSPESLLEAAHQPGRTLQLLQDFGIPPSQVVIELTEQTPIDDFQLLQTALHHYRAMGFSIALDDLGAGYSSLRLWSELRPDYVKIDRHFIDGIHQDALKREFVGSILQIAKASRAQVIAEGIELPEELAVLTEMGVDLVQGYLLGRPQEHPPRDARALMPKHDSSAVALNDEGSDLSALLIDQPAVNRDTPTATVLEAFRRQANLNSLAVLDEQGQPCGIVHRHSLSDALLKPFATDLFARKPISRLMNDDFLAVEMSQSLQTGQPSDHQPRPAAHRRRLHHHPQWQLSGPGSGDRCAQTDYRAENSAGSVCQSADSAAGECADSAMPDTVAATGAGVGYLLCRHRQFQAL
jgi:EAL domain-containing protein (putative c-di-GMP-specific phosphodiesterase class I)